MRSNSCCFYQRKRKLRSFTTDSLFVHAVRLSVGRCAFPIAGALCMQRFPFGHFPSLSLLTTEMHLFRRPYSGIIPFNGFFLEVAVLCCLGHVQQK